MKKNFKTSAIFSLDRFSEAVDFLAQKIDALEKRLPSISNKEPTDDLMDLDAVSKFLGISKYTVLGYTSSGTIPFSKPGKKLYFSRAEIVKWVKESAKKRKE